MSLFQVTKKQTIENYELRTMTGDIVSFTPSYSQLLPDPFSDLNVTVNVLATGGNGTPDNPNPIVGYSSVNITRCGVNLWDEVWELGTINDSTGEDTPMSDRIRSKNYIPVKNGQTYYFTSTYLHKVIYYDINKNFVSGGDTAWDTKQTYILPNNVYYIRFAMAGAYGTTYNNDISINYPTTDTTYHAYNGQTYTIAFGQTVYGGVLDVTRGKLTVTYDIVDLGSKNWTYNSGNNRFDCNTTIPLKSVEQSDIANMICSEYETVSFNTLYGGHDKSIAADGQWLRIRNADYTDATAFKNSLNGVYLCFERATPVEIDLTPEVISAVVGTNNVFAGCGNVTVTCLI